MNRWALWLGLVTSGLLLAVMVALIYQRTRPAALAIPLEDSPTAAAPQWTPRPIVDFVLIDSQEAEFDSQQLRGRVWVASFFFSTCPSICRQQNELLRQLWRQFGSREVRFLSITCDPEIDTPERLRDYARLYEADPEQWFFLTGDLEHISQIGEESFQLGVGYRTHSDRFVAVDKWGRVRGIYDWHERRELDALKTQLEQLLEEQYAAESAPQS